MLKKINALLTLIKQWADVALLRFPSLTYRRLHSGVPLVDSMLSVAVGDKALRPLADSSHPELAVVFAAVSTGAESWRAPQRPRTNRCVQLAVRSQSFISSL